MSNWYLKSNGLYRKEYVDRDDVKRMVYLIGYNGNFYWVYYCYEGFRSKYERFDATKPEYYWVEDADEFFSHFKPMEIRNEELLGVSFTWETSKGTVRKNIFNNNEDIYTRVGRTLNSIYFRLDEEDKCVYAYPVSLCNTARRGDLKDAYWGVNRCWFFKIDKNKAIYETHDGGVTWKKKSRFTNYMTIGCQKPEVIRDIFGKFFDRRMIYKCCAVSDEDIIKQNYKFSDYISSKETKTSEKTQKSIDAVCKEIDSCEEWKPYKSFVERRYCSTGIKYVMDYSKNIGTLYRIYSNGEEISRIFKNKDKMKCVIKSGEGWKAIREPKYKYYDSFVIAESCLNGEYKYLVDIFNDYLNNHQRGDVFSFIKDLISVKFLEQALKATKDNELKKRLYCNRDLRNVFGPINEDKKTLFGYLGINKYQFENWVNVVSAKKILRTSDISFINEDDWKKISEATINTICLDNWSLKEVLSYFCNMKAENRLTVLDKVCKVANVIEGTDWSSKRIVNDYYRKLTTLINADEDVSQYPVVCKNMDEYTTMHDRTSLIVSSKQNELKDKLFTKACEYHARHTKDDGTYMITYPKKSYDLIREGNVQSICIGGYVDSYINGNSRLFFLRKCSEPDTPFYAIEVRNGEVIQIHGKHNKWLSADDEGYAAVPFVMKWLKENNFKCRDEILLSTSTGYWGGNASLRTKPVID